MAPLNASSWKLNAAEKKELEERVKGGEQEAAVKKELQTKKAQANADRKAAAQAVSEKCKLQQQPKAKAKAKSAAAMAAPPPGADEAALNDAANKAYYLQVLEDYQLVLSEMGGEAFRSELPLPIADGAGHAAGGVQDPFCRQKALQAISGQGVYRCSISICWVNPMASPTPGVPMARRRVEDLSTYYFGPTGEPKYQTDRFIEVAISASDIDTERPNNLQVISPEEVLHATFAACARAIK